MGHAGEKTNCNIELDLLSIQGLAALLSLENKILEQFAKTQIHSKQDVLGVMDVWAKVANVQNDGFANPSDRIAMNIFRHMTSEKFFKG